MSSGGFQIRNQKAIHFITFSVVEWVDIFTRPCYADILIETLRYCTKQKGLVLYGWVIMPNHVHIIARSQSETQGLSDLLRDLKKYSSMQILKLLIANPLESRKGWMIDLFSGKGRQNVRNKGNWQFWNQENHPEELHSEAWLVQKLNYIHENPVRAGLVWEPHHYRYSSAADYQSHRKGLVDIELLSF